MAGGIDDKRGAGGKSGAGRGAAPAPERAAGVRAKAARRPGGTKPKAAAAADKDLVGGERLQRFLSRCGVASRRAAEEWIVQGRIEVNGEVVTTLGTRVVPGRDEVRVDGERVRTPSSSVVLLLNKPVGVLCSREDPESRPLVYGLLPADPALRSIGRLDFHTEGVLLFTNDGDLAERLAHPRFGIERTYEARVRGLPGPETLARLVRGVILEDGPARVLSAEVTRQTDRNAWIKLTLQEGRNREVRRILERVGHPVMRLRRVRFAGLGIGKLKPGQWRLLEESEIEALQARGHVGSFDLPPDPRKRLVQAAGLAETAQAPRRRELPPLPKPPRERTPSPAAPTRGGKPRDRVPAPAAPTRGGNSRDRAAAPAAPTRGGNARDRAPAPPAPTRGGKPRSKAPAQRRQP